MHKMNSTIETESLSMPTQFAPATVALSLLHLSITTAQNATTSKESSGALKVVTAEIVVGCTLALSALAIVLALVCRNWSVWCRYGTYADDEYKKIRDVEENKTRRRVIVLGHFFRKRKACENTQKLPSNGGNQSPIIRIHQVEQSVSPSSTPPPPTSRSPAISRSSKTGDIPFQLPPSVPGRFTEVLHVQPEIANCHNWSRDRTWSHDRVNQSDSGSSDGADITTNGIASPDERKSATLPPPPGSPSINNNLFSRSPNQYRSSMLGKIQPELYRYSECKDTDLPQSRNGRVWFSLVYDGAVETLKVKIIKVKQLQARANDSSRNCFVKLFLLPDERTSQQTKTVPRSNNPAYNESFVFQVFDSEVRERNLRFSVYDVEKKKSTRNLLGHALVSLKDVDLSRANEVLWRDLDDIAHPGDTGTSIGELRVALSYVPNLERLTVVVLDAKNLRKMDLEATAIYVKVVITQGHRVVKSKKTASQSGVSDPRFNESFSFKVASGELDQSCVTLTVITNGCSRGALHRMTSSLRNTVTRGRHSGENKYGKLTIGSSMHCRGEQLFQWQEMLSHPRKSVTKWHALTEVPVND